MSRRARALVSRKTTEQFPVPSFARSSAAGPAAAGAGGKGSYASYASVAAGRTSTVRGKAEPYLAMLMDPQAKDKGVRYPDETIVPTSLVHLASSVTWEVPAGANTVAAGLRWKCSQDSAGGLDVDPIFPPIDIPSITGTTAWVDYGTPQTTWSSLSAVDRSLALGIRVRVVGLPTSTFLPSGTLYFLQMQMSEFGGLISSTGTEQDAIQAVLAGKGFSITVNELSKMDGVTLPYLPQGPMSYVFSDTNSEAPASAGAGAAGAPASTVVSANGLLWIVGFGLQPGQTLRFDYAHHIEYIPRVTAAGLVATRVEAPDQSVREAISRGSQVVQSSLAGATSATNIKPLITGGAAGVIGSVAKAAVGMIPGGSLLVGGASMAAEALGAPQWLKSAIATLM